ncbi:GNAT family N-acetyltransferase [Pseudaminobacter arsenicus]|uniref:GNAT family N-acetyltransferase n=1 Tax=Borborobacter arsenicus TaxID=1851146 RepID=A0A432VA10_9HYPH|nr:GNAT family N-acetyltransferase [Pseudaminobacter arsenicus]RUM98935.1 GNAT family N-acetyltransferase [Pseudaminobacter arsenicus]
MNMPSSSTREKLEPTLRAIRPSDAEALCAMANMPGFRRGTLRMPFETVESWEKRIAKAGAGDSWIVAEVDGKIVGHGNLVVRSTPRRAHIGEIVMGVADDFVGRGIGTAILSALLDVADNWRGLKRVELTVYADNEPAIRLYESRGFEVEGRHIKAGFSDGKYHDLLTMARLRF